MLIILKNENIEVKINSLGAEVVSVKAKDGFEYIWQGQEWESHAPVLFPLCGRILNDTYTYGGKKYNMDVHGFACKTEFLLIEKDENHVKLSIKSNEKTLSIYPFEFELTAEYTIKNNNLTANFRVSNNGNSVMPYMIGWHPGFSLSCPCDISKFYIDFKKNSLVLHPLANGPFLSDKKLNFELPDGKYYLDEEYIKKSDTLIFTDTSNCVTLGCDCDKKSVDLSFSNNIPYFCIWKSCKNHARFICLEPWSDVPCDGITPENFETRKMSRLDSHKSKEYSFNVKFN